MLRPPRARRTGQLEPPSSQSTWAGYVASWPAWRDPEVCDGVCLTGVVCGRARVCLRTPDVHAGVVCALARLSASARERVPPYGRVLTGY